MFSGISADDYAAISAAARVREFTRGEVLYLEGDAVEQVLLLTSGSVKITRLGLSGVEVILGSLYRATCWVRQTCWLGAGTLPRRKPFA